MMLESDEFHSHLGKPPHYFAKIVLAGECGVGKSSLLRAFCDSDFSSSYVATIGVDFRIKKVQLDDIEVKLHIWDTAGQERYTSMTTSYFRGASGILLCYDASDTSKCVPQIRKWLDLIKRGASNGVCIMLVGTKLDKCYEYDPNAEYDGALKQGDALSREFNLPNVQTSSLDNVNIRAPFMHILQTLKHKDALCGTSKSKHQTDIVSLRLNQEDQSSTLCSAKAGAKTKALSCACARC